MGALTAPHSASHPKSNHRSGLEKSCNRSDCAAPGNTKFVESGYHLLVILFTKISGSLRILTQVLPHNTIDNTSIHIQILTFVCPWPTYDMGKEQAAQCSWAPLKSMYWGAHRLVKVNFIIYSDPSFEVRQTHFHSVAKHFELFLKCLTSTTKIAKMGIFGKTSGHIPHSSFLFALSVVQVESNSFQKGSEIGTLSNNSSPWRDKAEEEN